MSTFLFDTVIFGPVWSRRLGESLGINLLPSGRKVCNFSCIYCECGLTPYEENDTNFPAVEKIKDLLDAKLQKMKENGDYLDSITFAGNGEPTLHPEFPEIMDETIKSRNRYFPGVKIAVLSNATLIGEKSVFNTLLRADLNILKLDSAIEETLTSINCPRGRFHLSETLDSFRQFGGKLIIQTLFLKGTCQGKIIDNTTEKEITAWLAVIEKLRPESVMIYSLARDTAVSDLQKVSPDELNAIAGRVEKAGIKTMVTP
jgi:wyosine [tRNA(Phe)-imidazoG37] synthetase (radical SAM superfamily)